MKNEKKIKKKERNGRKKTMGDMPVNFATDLRLGKFALGKFSLNTSLLLSLVVVVGGGGGGGGGDGGGGGGIGDSD